MKKSLSIVILSFIFSGTYSQDFSVRTRKLVSRMTLEEKAQLVVGTGMHIAGFSTGKQVLQKVPGAAGQTFAIPRLGIPAMVLSDGPAGVRIDPFRNNDSSHAYYATAFPVATLLASTWDTALVKKVGVAFGSEIKDYGIDVILGPAMNIHRNPLGGRNFEYYSEDPLLSGNIAAAMVNGIQSNGVGTSIKHFAGNNEETNRNTQNDIVSERALREIYLKGFEIAVKKAHPWTVMSSYNKINGTYTSQDYDLLTTILRKEWGFKGLVMTDWFGGVDPVAQMKAGNDLLMPGTPKQVKDIEDAVKNGQLKESVLDENAERVLNLMFRSPSFKKFKYSDKPNLKKDAEISRNGAEEGMVLLKNNDKALPFTKSVSKIALFGNNAYHLIAGGTGSGEVNKAYTVSLEQGLVNAGYKIDSGVKNLYNDYLQKEQAKRPKKSIIEEFMHPTPPIKEYVIDEKKIEKSAADNNVAIIAIGRNAGEGNDRKVDDDFNLSDTERALIQQVSDAFHHQNKKVIVVLNIGGVIEVASWRDNPDAILLAWQPGQEGGNAITAILDGKVNPSGRLATTFPMKYEDEPTAKGFPGKEYPDKAETGNFGMKRIPMDINYDEGIYVGYRYFNSFNVKPAYEFGFGLSYTHFAFSDLKLSSKDFRGKIIATLNVKNTGQVAGKEVVQLYISAPAHQMDKPSEELKGFAKTTLLKPGQSTTIRFVIDPMALASFQTSTASWVADAGDYTLKIGASCRDIRLSSSFNLKKDLVVEKDHNVLKPRVSIDELKNK